MDRIEPLQLEVTNLLKKSVELQRDNVALKGKYDDLQKETDKYKHLLREEKRTKVSIDEKRKGVVEELDRLSKKVETHIAGKDQEHQVDERKKLKDEVIELKAQVRAYKLETTDHVEDIRKLKDELEEAEQKLREKDRALDRATSNVSNIEAQLRETEAMLLKNKEADEKAIIARIEKESADLRKKITSKREKSKGLKETNSKLDRETKDQARQISSLEKQIEELEDEKKVAQDKNEELGKKVLENADHVLDLKQQVDKLNEEAKKNAGLKSEIAQQLEEMKSGKFAAAHAEDDLAKSLEETSQRYEKEKLKASNLQIELDRLTIEIEDSRKYSSEIESLRNKLKDVKQKKKTIKGESKDFKKELDRLTREKTEAEEDKSLLASELDSTKEKLKTMQSQGTMNVQSEQQELQRVKSEYDDKLKKAKESKKQLEEEQEKLNEKLKQKDTADAATKATYDRRVADLALLLEKEKQSKQKDLDEYKKKFDDESKGALARKERMEDEIKTLKAKIKDFQVREAALEAEKKRKLSTGSTAPKVAELTDREKALKAQFDRLKELVAESEKANKVVKDHATDAAEAVKDKLVVGREQLTALKRATKRLQEQVDARRDRLTNAGVDELGLFEVLEEEEDKLDMADEELVNEIVARDEATLDRFDAVIKNLSEKLEAAKQKNKARVLIEVKELVKEITARLSDRLSHKLVENELTQSTQVVSHCKKLQHRIVHEMEALQVHSQELADNVRSLRWGWWNKKGTHDREEEIEVAVNFLTAEAERLTELRDKYIISHNHVASLCESVHKAEKDLVKWKLGLEELQDRVTVGSGWGHAALSARLLACRRLLDRQRLTVSALDASKARRSTLHLCVDNFTEGLYVVFNEGIDGLGSRGIRELTRIRDLEGQVMAVREEIDEEHKQKENKHNQHRVDTAQGHAGVTIVETLIKHFDAMFDHYSDEDVPEIVIKSVDYLLDNSLKDKSLLLHDYDLPKIKQIKEFFDAGTYDVDLSDCNDHRVVAELLKSYLRESHETLLTSTLYNDWLVVDELVDEKQRMEAIMKLLRKLPETNYATLATIIDLLDKIAQRAKYNKCNARLLARTFGPLLLRKTTPGYLSDR